MKTGDRKYLTLSGNPLHVPLWKTFHQAAGVQAGALCAAFTLAADMVTNSGAMLPGLLPLALGVPLVVAAKYKMLESLVIDTAFGTNVLCMPFKPTGKPLAINTQPHADLRTPDDLVSKARDTRNMALGCLTAFGLGTACGIVEMQSMMPASMSLTALGVAAQIAAPAFATWTECAYRFNKVVKGEHVIVKAPPKRKPEEVHETSGLKHAWSFG